MNRSLTFAGTVLGGIVAGVLLTTIATSTLVASGVESVGALVPTTVTSTPASSTTIVEQPPITVTTVPQVRPPTTVTTVPPAQPPTTAAEEGTGALRPGATGLRVRAMQERLRELGYWLGTSDGSYGSLTVQAVMAFQKVNGLDRDGIAGATTLAALDTASRPDGRSTSGNLVEVDKERQVLFVVRDGEVEWAVNVSTGTEKPYQVNGRTEMADTPPGRWTVAWAENGIDWGELGGLYRPRYFHADGIAVHGYHDVPAYPASHGCVRVANQVMDWIWSTNVMPLGSAVWVY
jgi:peptidoglycan hydrolase-like protein with peptidoglycan-binding domain